MFLENIQVWFFNLCLVDLQATEFDANRLHNLQKRTNCTRYLRTLSCIICVPQPPSAGR